MPAYEWFPAGAIDTALQNIKNKAEAYGWAIDFFGTYSSHNRLHLHNSDGAHFELWYGGSSIINICACTGYASGSAPTGQPGVSGTCSFTCNLQHLVIVGPHSIYIKTYYGGSWFMNFQFGYIVNKVGAWSGGFFISNVATSNSHGLWGTPASSKSQVYINGAWSSASSSTAGGAVSGAYALSLHSKMPFSYSGGILPAPLLLTQFDPVTTSYRHPIGYAPDAKAFAGGDVYLQLEEITIDGDVWVGVSQTELAGAMTLSPDILIRLAG